MEGSILVKVWYIDRILIGRNEKWNFKKENSLDKGREKVYIEVRKYKVCVVDSKKDGSL